VADPELRGSAIGWSRNDKGRVMTGWVVEREMRTACPWPSVPSTGVATSLPPHIQGAERRTEHRAGHTDYRWNLRVLVDDGPAGAAWLLTGGAAHAADRTDEPVGSPLGSVVDGAAAPPVTGIRTAAVQPLETVHPAHQHVATELIEVARRVPARITQSLDEIGHGQSRNRMDAAIDGSDQVLRELAGPIRLTGGPASAQHHSTAKLPDTAMLPDTAKLPDTVLPDTAMLPDPGFLRDVKASSSMASHLPPFASDVEARRIDAEAKTVSPD
jgi:hypothetical protein